MEHMKKFDLLIFLDKVKNGTLSILSLVAILLVTFYVVKSIVDKNLSIARFSIPKQMIDLNYTENSATQVYLDEINNISKTAKTLYAKKEYSYQKELDMNIPFVNTAISIGTTKSFLQKVFGIDPNLITGDIRMLGQDSLIELTTRYKTNAPVIVSGNIAKYKTLAKQSAEKLLKYFDPYILASYYESYDNDFESVEIINYAISTPPQTDNKWAFNLWGKILMKHELNKEAKQKFNKAIALDSSFFLPYYNLGVLAEKDTNYNEAMLYYQKSLARNKKFERACCAISSVYMQKKDLINAGKNIDAAIKINPEVGESYFFKGNIFLSKKDTLRAIEFIEQAIEKNNTDSRFYILLGRIEFLQNNKPSALQLLSRAYLIDKSDLKVAIIFRYYLNLNGDTLQANKLNKIINDLVIIKKAKDQAYINNKEKLIH